MTPRMPVPTAAGRPNGGLSVSGTLDVGVGTELDGTRIVEDVLLDVVEGEVNNEVVVGIVVVGMGVDEDGETIGGGVVVVIVDGSLLGW